MEIGIIDIQLDPKRPGVTGLSSVAWDWARYLMQHGEQVHLIGPYPVDVRGPDKVLMHRFPIPPGGYRSVIGNLLVALRAVEELRKIKSLDIVHCPEYLSTAVAGLMTNDIPIILTTPGNIYERIAHANPYTWLTTQVYKLAAIVSAKKCSKIIAISHEMMYWWQKTGVNPSNLIMIPNGVDVNFFHPIPNARDKLYLSENRMYIVYAGRLSHEKGLTYLFEAFFQVTKLISDIELHILGDGSQMEALKMYADKLEIRDQVKFHGWVCNSKLPYFYSAADVVVLPSISEGHPRTVLEAMACGSSFIGTRVSGIEDTVVDRETGILVPARDTDQLAKAIFEMIKDRELARKMGIRARQRILNHYSWETIINSTINEVYQPVLTGN